MAKKKKKKAIDAEIKIEESAEVVVKEEKKEKDSVVESAVKVLITAESVKMPNGDRFVKGQHVFIDKEYTNKADWCIVL